MTRILFFLLLLSSEFNYGQNYFEKIFYNRHGTACAREDSAGNIIVSFPEDSVIMKCDGLANTIWTRSYNFSTYVFEILNNGTWIGGGYKLIDTLLFAHTSLLDANGDTLWTRIVDTLPQKRVYQMKIDFSGNYIFTVLDHISYFNALSYVFKMDSNGNSIDSIFFGIGHNFHFNIINSNLIVSAATVNSPIFPVTCQVDGYDSTLKHIWSQTLIDTISIPHTYQAGIVFPNTNNHIVVGGHWDWYTTLFDLDPYQLNNTSYCLTNVDFIDVIQVSTGGYLCIGTTPVSNPKGFAMLLDTWFQAIWYSEFPGINGVNALFAQETNDGGFLISGSTIDFNSNTIPWLIKLDQYGSTTTGIDDIKHNKLFQINQINNSFEITQSKGNKLIVYDMLGNVVKSLNNISNKFSIEIFEKQGIYLFALYKDNELLESKKIFNP